MIAATSATPEVFVEQLAEIRDELKGVKTLQDALELRERAERLAVSTEASGIAGDIKLHAAEIEVRLAREVGRFLKSIPLSRGGRPPRNQSPMATGCVSLKDLGISKTHSQRWQAMADLPDEEFESFVLESRNAGEAPSTRGAAKLGKKYVATKQEQFGDAITCDVQTLGEAASLGVKFPCIYADPPWAYGNQATRASTDNHYPTMTLAEIAALPVASLAADKALLFFWTTNAFLFDSKPIIEAWGFEYKSVIVWCKPQMGIGNYVRVSHEFLLIASRGGLRSRGENQMSWIEQALDDADAVGWVKADRKRHSEKPRAFREIIEDICPYAPRLELFAREAAPGWVAWGNQVEKTLFTDSISELSGADSERA